LEGDPTLISLKPELGGAKCLMTYKCQVCMLVSINIKCALLLSWDT
jgi:hypothetical protein